MSTIESTAFDPTVRETLLHERDTVASRLTTIANGASDAWTDSDGVPMSSDDRDQALTDVLGRHLINIDDALSRLDAGTYGICGDCNQPIPSKRLAVAPFATLCVACQSKRDKRAQRRPV